MKGLRWILLVVGVAFIAFVYLFTRYQLSRRGASARRARAPEPEVDLFDHIERMPADTVDSDDDVRRELARMAELVGERDEVPAPKSPAAKSPAPKSPAPKSPAAAAAADAPAHRAPAPDEPAPEDASNEERLIVLSVMAPGGHPFRGSALRAAFERAGLEFGDMNIFHRVALVGAQRQPVFSVASAVKPGTFEPGAMEDFATPGLSLFLQLPAPVSGVEAFDDLVNTAERLAAELGGVLRDQEHHAVTHQMLMHVRQQIAGARISPQRSAL